MSKLRELYQEVIVDHSRHPRNFSVLSDANRQAKGFNPLCGDKLDLYLRVEKGVILEASFQGEGCAISTASASLLTEFLPGKTLQEVQTMFERFHQMLTEDSEEEPVGMGKLLVLAGVKEFPARVKCATLAWHTLQAALTDQDKIVSTEED